MSTPEVVTNRITEHLAVIGSLTGELAVSIATVGRRLAGVLSDGGVIYWCGNGGSASDSQHLAAELVGRFKEDRRALRSIALSSDTSVLTCIGNDFGYDQVFSRQVEALGQAGDALVGISTSGESTNIIRALETARTREMLTVGLLGKGGGAALELVDEAILIPSHSTARIQEAHILIGHIFCEIVELELNLA